MKFTEIFSIKEGCSIDFDTGTILMNAEDSANAKDLMLFPGLVNSHDHLDFNIFPSLKSAPCSNYRQWGKAIQENFRNEIRKVKEVPFSIRYEWGLYLNLLNGITTVIDHGNQYLSSSDIIDVYRHKQDLHSVGFEKNWRAKLNNPFRCYLPVVVHTGEGTDSVASNEISSLTRWNIFNRPLIGIHGIAMNTGQAKKFKALVWCPASNDFLFKNQPKIDQLKLHTKILFGTDSTLTAGWSIWDHLRFARTTGLLSDHELFDTVTMNAHQFWKADQHSPRNENNYIIAKRNCTLNRWDAFYSLTPADIVLVVHNGQVKLIDHSLVAFFNGELSAYEAISLNNSVKYVVNGLHKVYNSISSIYPEFRFPFQIIPKTEKAVLC
jgi:hypothetical protein